MDVLTPEQRKKNMQHIRGKDTSIEVAVRKELFRRGFRYRKNDSRYPGKPDIVLPKYHTVIFVNGCYWHRHENCKYATTPKTNVEFWEKKFSDNVKKDAESISALEADGWRVITLWECELKKDFKGTIEKAIQRIQL